MESKQKQPEDTSSLTLALSPSKPIYTFIHIPKCGGTCVENFFQQYYSDRITGTTHKWVATKDNHPIIIIRNPVDRFLSLYNYWKNGSHGRNYRNADFRKKYGHYTIKDFIQNIKEQKTQDLVIGYMWRLHYYPMSYWFPRETYSNAIVVTYVNHLNHKIQQLLDYCQIERKAVVVTESNVTIKNPAEKVELDEEDYEWLYSHFKEDFELWENAFLNPYMFQKVF